MQGQGNFQQRAWGGRRTQDELTLMLTDDFFGQDQHRRVGIEAGILLLVPAFKADQGLLR